MSLILNVDDFEPQLYRRSSILRAAGFQVVEATTGRQALAVVGGQQPDLLVLDVRLPDLSGLEVCREIKSRTDVSETLVLLVSATFGDAAARSEALENGADAYLAEPVEADELVAQVRSLLRRAVAEREARQAQEALRESRERLRSFFDASGVLMCVVEVDGDDVVYLTPNANLAGFFGLTAQELSGKRGRELGLSDEVIREWLALFRRCEAEGKPVTLEYPFAFRNHSGWYHATVSQIRPSQKPRFAATIIDVTERRRASEALQESEEKFRRSFANAVIGFAMRTPDGRLVDANAAYCRLTGYDVAELRQMTLQQMIHPEDLDANLALIAELTAGRISDFVLENRYVRRDGTAVWVRKSVTRVPKASGEPGWLIALAEDITERKRTETALRESEEVARRRAEEVQQLMHVIPAAIWVAEDPDCRLITGNATANEFYEASGGENVSAGPASGGKQDTTRRFFQDGVELPPEALPMQRAVSTGQEVGDTELDVVLPSGGRKTILGGARPLFSAGGAVRGGIAAFIDISARKRAETAAQQAKDLAEAREAEIAAIYDSAPIGLCILDRGGRFQRVNRRMAEINGVAPEAHMGRTVREVVPALAAQAERLLRHVVDTGTAAPGVEVTGEFSSQPGVTRTRIENWHPVRDGSGAVTGVNVAVEEITALKEVERELRQANRVKDEFLATLSHELRTPLTAILGWAHLLERGTLDAAGSRQAVEAIARNADAQRQLITDVLDVSRMMSGKLRLEVREVEVVELARFAVESLRPALEAKGLGVELAAQSERAVVTADPARLQQVVWNLLSNAVKFSPPGGRISVRVSRTDDGVELVVADTGIGIAPDFLPHVFDRFAQADSSSSRRHSGLGLGLSIVRQLVELHGGTVYASSQGVGQGATFTVRLPVRAVRESSLTRKPATESTGRGAAPVRRLNGLRVLVLDDVEDARSLLETLIAAAGGQVASASSCDEALASLAVAPVDLVLADIALPGADGYEFLRRLKEETTTASIPVIALTAYGSAADRQRALAAGFAGHMSKPVTPDELLDVLARVATGQP